MSDAAIAFELHNVTHQFDHTCAIADLSCTIAMGERVGLIGPSGAGKSTLLRLLNLTLAPTMGDLCITGESVATLSNQARRRLQRQIGTIYQQLHLVDNLRVIHNVNAGNLGRWSWMKALASLIYPLHRPAAQAALMQVGIPEKMYERTDRLSGGQQQRVAIARVLIQNPAIVLADEPTASLDPELSQDVMDLLCRLCSEQGRTFIVSLHDVELARRYCDRLIGLRQGRMVFDTPTAQVTDAMLSQLYQREAMALHG